MRHVCVQVKLDLIYANPESAPKLKMNSISIQVEFFGLSERGIRVVNMVLLVFC